MCNVNSNWSIIVGVISAVWILIIFIRDRRLQSITHTNEIMKLMMEDDRIYIEYPEIQMYLSQNSKQDVEYFRNETVLKDAFFYKVKTAVYKQINLFDEILSTSHNTKWRCPVLNWICHFLKPPLIEEEDWEAYMKEKFRHPLYQSILKHEKHIYGKSLRDFWGKNREEILSLPVDPFIW